MFTYPKKLAAAPQAIAKLTVQTKIDGVPTRRRISIIDRVSQLLLWHSFTNPDGEITRRLPLKYATGEFLCITAFDDTSTYNAVIADNAQAELAP